MSSPAPRYAPNDGVAESVRALIGDAWLDSFEAVGELTVLVKREGIADAVRALRDELEYQQLMDIAGIDFPQRPERFEVAYMLLSVTRNHRIRLKLSTDEDTPVPSVTSLFPNAGWYEREVYDMFGVLFDGNPDLRRILTDYGFRGHPFRKDFPMTGYTELRWSEELKRVVSGPVRLNQDFRAFDFLSPWEGAAYVLPGDEKVEGVAPGAMTPAKAGEKKA